MADAKTELNEIKRDGATPQPNSGRGVHAKADAILEPFCIDYKEYTESFSVSRTNWAKLQSDAFKSGRREPAFKLVLGEEGKKDKLRLWVISDAMFHELLDTYHIYEDLRNS